jgi:hypothetical protein
MLSKPPVRVNQTYFSLSSINVEPKYYHPNHIGLESQRCMTVFRKDEVNPQ